MEWWTTSSSLVECGALGQKKRQQRQRRTISRSNVSLSKFNSNHHSSFWTAFRHLHIYQPFLEYLSLSLVFASCFHSIDPRILFESFHSMCPGSTSSSSSSYNVCMFFFPLYLLFLRQIVNFRLDSNSVQHYCNHHITILWNLRTHREWIQLLLNIHRP